MDETAEVISTAEANPPGRTRSGPTEAERLELIRSFQAQALAQPDPLAANLQLLSGDLMLFAHRSRQMLEAGSVGAGSGVAQQEQFTRQAELHLKFVRQIDRLAQITRQLSLKGPKKAT
jgi:hypothetical protein